MIVKKKVMGFKFGWMDHFIMVNGKIIWQKEMDN
jgi:hypothetical protein